MLTPGRDKRVCLEGNLALSSHPDQQALPDSMQLSLSILQGTPLRGYNTELAQLRVKASVQLYLGPAHLLVIRSGVSVFGTFSCIPDLKPRWLSLVPSSSKASLQPGGT